MHPIITICIELLRRFAHSADMRREDKMKFVQTHILSINITGLSSVVGKVIKQSLDILKAFMGRILRFNSTSDTRKSQTEPQPAERFI